MSAHFCPDCGWMPVPPPRPGKDGRCNYCRSQVGQRSRLHSRYTPDSDELAARFHERNSR